MKYFVFITILFSIVACESDLTLDDSGFEKEIVVNSILSSDSIFTVDLTYSSFFNDANISYVENAQVIIEDLTESRAYALIHSKDGRYVNPNIATKSHEYSLSVTTHENRKLSAETCIPNDLIVGISIDTIYDSERYIDELSIGVEIANDPDQDNFYTLELLPYFKRVVQEDSIFVNHNPDVLGENDLLPQRDSRSEIQFKNLNIFSDKGFDGKNISTSFNFGREDISFGDKNIVNNDSNSTEIETPTDDEYIQAYAVRITAVSSDLFDYMKSYEIYNQQGTITSTNSQPGKIIFNIENGIGVFGGTNTQIIPIN